MLRGLWGKEEAGKEVQSGGEMGCLGDTKSEVVADGPDRKAPHTPGNTSLLLGSERGTEWSPICIRHLRAQG